MKYVQDGRRDKYLRLQTPLGREKVAEFRGQRGLVAVYRTEFVTEEEVAVVDSEDDEDTQDDEAMDDDALERQEEEMLAAIAGSRGAGNYSRSGDPDELALNEVRASSRAERPGNKTSTKKTSSRGPSSRGPSSRSPSSHGRSSRGAPALFYDDGARSRRSASPLLENARKSRSSTSTTSRGAEGARKSSRSRSISPSSPSPGGYLRAASQKNGEKTKVSQRRQSAAKGPAMMARGDRVSRKSAVAGGVRGDSATTRPSGGLVHLGSTSTRLSALNLNSNKNSVMLKGEGESVGIMVYDSYEDMKENRSPVEKHKHALEIREKQQKFLDATFPHLWWWGPVEVDIKVYKPREELFYYHEQLSFRSNTDILDLPSHLPWEKGLGCNSIMCSTRYTKQTLFLTFAAFVMNFGFYGFMYGAPQNMADVQKALWARPAWALLLGATIDLTGCLAGTIFVSRVSRKFGLFLYFALVAVGLILFLGGLSFAPASPYKVLEGVQTAASSTPTGVSLLQGGLLDHDQKSLQLQEAQQKSLSSEQIAEDLQVQLQKIQQQDPEHLDEGQQHDPEHDLEEHHDHEEQDDASTFLGVVNKDLADISTVATDFFSFGDQLGDHDEQQSTDHGPIFLQEGKQARSTAASTSRSEQNYNQGKTWLEQKFSAAVPSNVWTNTQPNMAVPRRGVFYFLQEAGSRKRRGQNGPQSPQSTSSSSVDHLLLSNLLKSSSSPEAALELTTPVSLLMSRTTSGALANPFYANTIFADDRGVSTSSSSSSRAKRRIFAPSGESHQRRNKRRTLAAGVTGVGPSTSTSEDDLVDDKELDSHRLHQKKRITSKLQHRKMKRIRNKNYAASDAVWDNDTVNRVMILQSEQAKDANFRATWYGKLYYTFFKDEVTPKIENLMSRGLRVETEDEFADAVDGEAELNSRKTKAELYSNDDDEGEQGEQSASGKTSTSTSVEKLSSSSSSSASSSSSSSSASASSELKHLLSQREHHVEQHNSHSASLFGVSRQTAPAAVDVESRPYHMEWILQMGFLITKFAVHLGFSTLYLWIPELYPTEVRAQGLSLSMAVGRIGAILAPLAYEICAGFSPLFFYMLIFILYLAVVALVVFVSLKETSGTTIYEADSDCELDKPIRAAISWYEFIDPDVEGRKRKAEREGRTYNRQKAVEYAATGCIKATVPADSDRPPRVGREGSALMDEMNAHLEDTLAEKEEEIAKLKRKSSKLKDRLSAVKEMEHDRRRMNIMVDEHQGEVIDVHEVFADDDPARARGLDEYRVKKNEVHIGATRTSGHLQAAGADDDAADTSKIPPPAPRDVGGLDGELRVFLESQSPIELTPRTGPAGEEGNNESLGLSWLQKKVAREEDKKKQRILDNVKRKSAENQLEAALSSPEGMGAGLAQLLAGVGGEEGVRELLESRQSEMLAKGGTEKSSPSGSP
ncbi:unnamed protein product [Amoebophrya sp. A25]|nr:unnamed protein product [Amoebophrya sp. A25]|eukprot:GSA25T00003569001.1